MISTFLDSSSVAAVKDTAQSSFHLQFSFKAISDGNGIFISVVGYVVVFLSLLLLYLFLLNMFRALNSKRLRDFF